MENKEKLMNPHEWYLSKTSLEVRGKSWQDLMSDYGQYLTAAKDAEIEALHLINKALRAELISIRNCEAEILRHSVEQAKEISRLTKQLQDASSF